MTLLPKPSNRLRWLPEPPDWRARLGQLRDERGDIWPEAVRLANAPLDFVRTQALDALIQQRYGEAPPAGTATGPVRLAVLGSATVTHLLPAIQVAGLRRNIFIVTYEGAYGLYRQELADAGSALHAFRPDAVLLSLDARHIAGGIASAGSEETALDGVKACWERARALGASVLQQTWLDVFPPLLGSNEHLLPGSPSAFVARLNARLRDEAARAGVDLVAVDAAARRDGIAAWHDPGLWHRAKQEITPAQAPVYGELVARVIAARRGRSYKCLVLDLDNTLWGGVVGDDGVEGIVLGQGSALGEGFVALQEYARALAERGVILAVCSKNDAANAIEPFERHPEMVLRREHIACFRADWNDKAANIRAIAEELRIGLDAIVFLDDNPFERELVRQALPMVAVPEVPEDPALIPDLLADAGYFESVGVTDDDRARARQYQENRARAQLQAGATDLEAYLRGLEMRLVWRTFDALGQPRIVQLINKTNQFNLTTRRYGDAEVARIMADPAWIGLQLRLIDRFGDNGIVAVVIGERVGEALRIDSWLMSCRVLGRQVEQATLSVLADRARAMGATRLVGEYIPTAKNGMVRDLYERLGFTPAAPEADGRSLAVLDLAGYSPAPTCIDIIEG